MIEFKGEISKKTKKLIRRIDLLMLCVVFFAPAAFMVNFVGIPVFVSLYFGTTYMENLWLYIASFIGVSAIFVVSYFVLPLTDHIPLCIQIAPDGTVVTKTKKAQYTHGMDEIMYVKDLGEYYSIVIKEQLLCKGRTLCKKDLLTRGTIEEFERIYKDKIRRE